jgi:hypothetical protein
MGVSETDAAKAYVKNQILAPVNMVKAGIKEGEKAVDKAIKTGDFGGAAADFASKLATSSNDPTLAFIAGAYKSAYDIQRELEKTVKDFFDSAQKKAVGYVKDLFDENVCENGQGKAGKALNECYDRILDMIQYSGEQRNICGFRLGEAMAKADTRVVEQG